MPQPVLPAVPDSSPVPQQKVARYSQRRYKKTISEEYREMGSTIGSMYREIVVEDKSEITQDQATQNCNEEANEHQIPEKSNAESGEEPGHSNTTNRETAKEHKTIARMAQEEAEEDAWLERANHEICQGVTGEEDGDMDGNTRPEMRVFGRKERQSAYHDDSGTNGNIDATTDNALDKEAEDNDKTVQNVEATENEDAKINQQGVEEQTVKEAKEFNDSGSVHIANQGGSSSSTYLTQIDRQQHDVPDSDGKQSKNETLRGRSNSWGRGMMPAPIGCSFSFSNASWVAADSELPAADALREKVKCIGWFVCAHFAHYWVQGMSDSIASIFERARAASIHTEYSSSKEETGSRGRLQMRAESHMEPVQDKHLSHHVPGQQLPKHRTVAGPSSDSVALRGSPPPRQRVSGSVKTNLATPNSSQCLEPAAQCWPGGQQNQPGTGVAPKTEVCVGTGGSGTQIELSAQVLGFKRFDSDSASLAQMEADMKWIEESLARHSVALPCISAATPGTYCLHITCLLFLHDSGVFTVAIPWTSVLPPKLSSSRISAARTNIWW